MDNFVKCYAAMLIFLGIPSNCISFFVLYRDKSNRNTTRLLMIMLAIWDNAVLLTAVLRYWIRATFNFDIRVYNNIVCKIHGFLVSFSSDFAVGTLCAIAIERFIVVSYPQKSKTLVTITTVIFGMSGFALGNICKNGFILYLYNIDSIKRNRTNLTKLVCKPQLDSWISWGFLKVDLLTYAVFPYLILFFCNIYIFFKLRNHRIILNKTYKKIPKLMPGNCVSEPEVVAHPPPKKRRFEHIIKILTALSLIHAVTSLPGAIYQSLKAQLKVDDNPSMHAVIQESLLLLMFTNNAINIFAYLFSSTTFRRHFLDLMCCVSQPKLETTVQLK